jgi:hypothetical protein
MIDRKQSERMSIFKNRRVAVWSSVIMIASSLPVPNSVVQLILSPMWWRSERATAIPVS